MKLEKAKSIAEVLMWLGLVPQWIFMTSRGVPGGLLIAIFIMPILMIMTFVSFMMYVFIALEEKSVKDTWWQLLLTGAWLTFLLLIFTADVGKLYILVLSSPVLERIFCIVSLSACGNKQEPQSYTGAKESWSVD